MPAITKFQLGSKTEGTFGTEETVDAFDEYLAGTNLNPRFGRVRSKGMRKSTRVARKDRQVTYKAGIDGKLILPVLSKGFGKWLPRMVGGVSSSGATDSLYTHTATIGDMLGEGFTCQINKPFHPADTDYAVTSIGTKVAKWKISDKAGNDGPLTVELDVEGLDFDDDTSLASASYPSGNVEPLTFVGGAVTIGGSSVAVSEWSLECDNKLMLDRRYIRSSALRKEQVEGDWREIKWDVGCDWESEAQYDRFASLAASGAVAQIVLTYTGLILVGSATYPSLTITIDEASFDTHETSDPSAPMTQKIGGAGLFDGSASAITLAYANAESSV